MKSDAALSLPPDAPPVHRFLESLWPYLTRAAQWAAPRYGIEYRDLLHDFAVRIIETFDKFGPEPNQCSDAMAFVVIRIKRVLGDAPMRRWQRMSRRPELKHEPFAAVGGDPVELADLIEKLRELLAQLSPRRAAAVRARFGLDGIAPRAGFELGAALGIRGATASALTTDAVRELAHGFGADVRAAGLSRSEGIALGQAARAARGLGWGPRTVA